MTEDDPQPSAESPEDSGEVLLEWTMSGPINARGDRLKVKGKPSAMFAMIQKRAEAARIEAENRVKGFLERLCPWILEVGTREQVEGLVHVITNIAAETARERDAYIHEVLGSIMTYIPKVQCLPDPANHPNLMEVPADGCGPDPTVVDSSADGIHD